MTEKISLRTRIVHAQSEQEILDLLKEGETYQYANDRTASRWIKAAKQCRRELAQPRHTVEQQVHLAEQAQ